MIDYLKAIVALNLCATLPVVIIVTVALLIIREHNTGAYWKRTKRRKG